LVTRKVEVILALNGTPSAIAAMNATHEIPIVAPVVGDPVGSKLAKSLAYPGGNVTGTTNLASELYSKRLGLLKQALPELNRVALLMNDANAASAEMERLSQATGGSLGIEVQIFDVRDSRDFERTFAQISHAHVQAVLVGGDILFQGNMEQLGKLALGHRLPLISDIHAQGVLLAFTVNRLEMYRLAARHVDKILKGAKAGEIPFEQPTHFTLSVDLKTAKALGVSIPQSVLLRADEVIQ
jgi:putative ABC transport system substrate-binding protein